MVLNHRVEDQMASSLCFLRNPLPWVAALVPVLIFAGFLGFGVLSILITSSALILSTVLFTFSKQRPVVEEESLKEEEKVEEEEEVLRSDHHESLPHMEEVVSRTQTETDTITRRDEAQESGMSHQMNEYIDESPDSLSKTESLDQSSTSDESEVEWPFPDNAGQSPECSDGSISDEDSLIEIALLSGHYVDPKQEDPKFNSQKKLPDFTPDSIFQQHSTLMEVLAEMNEVNEEENLIEIDISMGSIKCSRFEIEA
ncbi:hypothetical protein PVL29_015759 [Vitis rotundifolia]|uniref:Uncharacterized protein n=1 Tax=Vitis rotundifolia TaxID=103349 RepID=A0AA39DKM0_VITRO|nr:hypothetical protein PVL29_015759 [Vitis rotundifolia]